jgi:3-dehydroquinate dehydratase II
MENKSINVLVINGPNLNFLGIREPGVYGAETWGQIENRLQGIADNHHIGLSVFQSNHQGVLVDHIQAHMLSVSGIIVNPAGYSSTGYALLDALMIVPVPFIEVHLSNIYARGDHHAITIFSKYAAGTISGLKGLGYELALRALIQQLK